MQYLKYRANQLFTGTEMLGNEFVLIAQPNGIIENIVSVENAGDDVQELEGMILPGLINAHCHTELSHLKNCIPQHTGLTNFILQIVQHRNANEEQITTAIQLAEEEMLENGIVAVGDICNTHYSVQHKQSSQLHWYNFLEVAGWLPDIAQKRFEQMQAMKTQFSMLNFPYSIVPHAAYSVSNNLWNLLQPEFINKTISVHNQETLAEDELFKNGTGQFINMYQTMNINNTSFQPTQLSSVQSYLNNLSSAKNILLVHNTFTTNSDIAFVQQAAVANNQTPYFCLCPNANVYIEDTLPNIELFRNNNVNLTLGTDSLASNTSLNIIEEVKTIQQHFPLIPLTEILQWATLNGAKALEMDNHLGSFETGKKPGIVLWNDTAIHRLA
jgi:cytosine/adenosine deaminase-related metal-dependent hydrolase